jgi:hypothetical protein
MEKQRRGDGAGRRGKRHLRLARGSRVQVHAYVRGPTAVCVCERVERFTHYSILVAAACPRDAGSLGLGWSGASHLGLWGRADGPQKPA